MWDEAVGDSLAALKLIPDWFVTSKMIKNLLASLYADENMIYFNEDSGNVPTGIKMERVFLIRILIILILIIILKKMVLIPLFLSDFLPGKLNLKNAKHLKKW